MTRLRSLFTEMLAEPMTRLTIVMALVVSLFIVLSAIYETLQPRFPQEWHLPEFISDGDKESMGTFIELFGILYSVVVSGVFVKVWDDFSNTAALFEKEAATIKIFHEEIMVVKFRKHKAVARRVLNLLHQYIEHTLSGYRSNRSESRELGDAILLDVRRRLLMNIGLPSKSAESDQFVLDRLLSKLDTLVELRASRILASAQGFYKAFRLFFTLVTIALALPLFAISSYSYGIMGGLLLLLFIFLLILLSSVIDDLDQPFRGFWSVKFESWETVRVEIQNSIEQLETSRNRR